MKLLFWKKPGLKKLGEIIYGSREAKGLSLSGACRIIQDKTGVNLAATTLSAIEKGHSKPEWDTLVAIAAAGFVELDGRRLNIFDFIAIASETEISPMNTALARLIQDHLDKNSLSLRDFSRATGVELGDLEAIMRGEVIKSTYDYETDLILIAGQLTNPGTGIRFHTFTEMCDYCGMVQIDGVWQQIHAAQNPSLTQ